MKKLSLLTIILLMGSCSSERADWDSGGDARRAFEEESRQEEVETLRDQVPPLSTPHTEKAQPF